MVRDDLIEKGAGPKVPPPQSSIAARGESFVFAIVSASACREGPNSRASSDQLDP
jgi:hypothetical protein